MSSNDIRWKGVSEGPKKDDIIYEQDLIIASGEEKKFPLTPTVCLQEDIPQ
jgi:hypothetical protein